MAKLFSPIRTIIVVVALAVILVVSQRKLDSSYEFPFPPFQDLPVNEFGFQDASIIAMGFRRLAADIAWVQFLQYLGGGDVFSEDKTDFPRAKILVLRVTRIDPYFKSAYYYGASFLAWIKTVNRPREAMEVISEGVHYNPDFWALRHIAAGIGYKITGERGKMITILEEAVLKPDCPPMLYSILASAYYEEEMFEKARRLYQAILQEPSAADYHFRARERLREIEEKGG